MRVTKEIKVTNAEAQFCKDLMQFIHEVETDIDVYDLICDIADEEEEHRGYTIKYESEE